VASHLYTHELASSRRCLLVGGMVAQVVAARHISLLHTLILGCTTISIAQPVNGPAVSVVDFPSVAPSTAAERRALVQKLMAANFTPAWVRDNQRHFEWLVDESMRWQRPMQATMQQNQAIGRFDGLATVKQIAHLPVLIIHGTLDGVIPVAQAHVLADRLEQADLVLLPEVGHLFWNQAEKDTKQAIGVFLDKHEHAIRQKQQAKKADSSGSSSSSSGLTAAL
jgi:pimeloyl-ACP methyl ester carboxylesterase